MRKSLLIMLACISAVIIFQAFTTSKEPTYKNLKILPQDISDHDLDSVMHVFTGSLGVKCNFCHVRNEEARKMDFASDDKPEKRIARQMMQMSIDLNKNYFKNMEHHDMDEHSDVIKEGDHDMKKDADHDMKMKEEPAMDIPANADPSVYMFRTVTCYTCHRGDSHPDAKMPPRPQRPPMPPPPPPAPAAN